VKLTERQQVIDRLAGLITSVERPHPIRVAIDGVDTAGKTTLANELVQPLKERGRHVIRASIDGFHRPRIERLRRGPDSPEGYYLDSFDLPSLQAALLIPLGPGGTRSYRRAVFDYRIDSQLNEPELQCPENAILLFDGVFLLRPALNDHWDFRVFIDIDFEEVVRRACQRDVGLFGSAEATAERYRKRYIPGQQIYLDTVRPKERADVIVENSDLTHPGLREGDSGARP
jgi:uridine kinase